VGKQPERERKRLHVHGSNAGVRKSKQSRLGCQPLPHQDFTGFAPKWLMFSSLGSWSLLKPVGKTGPDQRVISSVKSLITGAHPGSVPDGYQETRAGHEQFWGKTGKVLMGQRLATQPAVFAFSHSRVQTADVQTFSFTFQFLSYTLPQVCGITLIFPNIPH